jgi:hypothetical protein
LAQPNVRIECSVPRAVLDELVRREQQSGVYRSRVAAQILMDELIGGTHTYYPQRPHQ